MRLSQVVTRPPTKQLHIEQVIRRRMVDGTLPPGAQLPPRNDLEAEFDVSRDTMQRVFDQLQADGFIHANRRLGTCVVDRPPYLHRLALLFPDPMAEWPRFWHALREEAAAVTAAGLFEVVAVTHVVAHPDNAGYQQVLEEVSALRLAGIILSAVPGDLIGTP